MSDLHALFAPRGIAVIGASAADPTKMGSVMLRSLSTYDGPVLAVNERLTEPAPGLHASVADGVAATGAVVDLAVLCVPAPVCAGALQRAADAGVQAALVCAGGFAEVDEQGAAHQEALAAVARRHGVRLLGPNTSGFLAPHHRLHATFVPGAAHVPAGSVGVIAASGGVNHVLAFQFTQAGYGVSLAVGLGNAMDVGPADVLDHLAEDPRTSAIALHVESVTDGARLLEAVRRAAAVKPVVALVVGRADVGDFARSHTGALATAWRTTRAVLAQAGAVLVDDERELVDATGQLAQTRLAPSADPGVALVTAQAGPGLMVMDALRSHGVHMPQLTEATRAVLGGLLPPMTYQANPVDTGRPGDTFAAVLAATAADPGVDVVATYALAEADAVDLAEAVRSVVGQGYDVAVASGGTEAETVPVRDKLIADGVAVHGSPSALATGVRALVTDARQRHRSAAHDAQVDLPPTVSMRVAAARTWSEHDAKSLLSELGIATPARVVCATGDEAHAALAELTAPTVVKILDAEVLHKTEVGGVHLGVRTADELDDALRRLRDIGARQVLVEEMAPTGVDLIVGARRDPVFGPVVLVGLGGTVAEAVADVALRSAPVTDAEARAMPGELVTSAVLHGWRGGPELDTAELARILRSLGQLLVDHPGLDEVEINPLRLTHHGLIALDAVITTRSHHGHPHP